MGIRFFIILAALNALTMGEAAATRFTYCQEWLGPPLVSESLADDRIARGLVYDLLDQWVVVDRALGLASSIARRLHNIDRLLGRPPEGPGAWEERSRLSERLLKLEWEHLHAIDGEMVARCLELIWTGAFAPSVSDRLGAAFMNAHLDLEGYLAVTLNHARLTGPWSEVNH